MRVCNLLLASSLVRYSMYFLLTFQVELNKKQTADEYSPLIIAAINGHSAAVQVLLDHKAVDDQEDMRVNQDCKRGLSALFHAYEQNHPAIISQIMGHPDIAINKVEPSHERPILILAVLGMLEQLAYQK